MKNLFATASYSFNNFYNNLNTQGQMIFSAIMFLIVILCILLFITYVIQGIQSKVKIKKIRQEILNDKNNLEKQKEAIISIDELMMKAKELELIDDDENTGVNYLEKYNLEPAEVENVISTNNNLSKNEVKAFKVSQVISPIYGVKKEVINNDNK